MILTIINPHASYYLGGTEVVTLHQALSLAKRGHTIRYITSNTESYSDYYIEFKREAAALPLDIVEVTLPSGTPLADGSWSRYYQLSSIFGMAAQSIYRDYLDSDVFVTHLSIDSLFIPLEVKNILHLHGSPITSDIMMSTALTRPAAALAHSGSIFEWWSTHYPNIPMNIFRNGIDITNYSGDPTGSRPIDVLYVGRFLEHKGVDDLLQAVPIEASIVVAGNGPYLDTLRTIADSRGLRNVQFYDTPDTATLRRLYASAKVFACPSRAKEGVLTTMLEAAASGCAVVTASGSGMTDLAIDTVNSRVISPGNIEQLAQAIHSLLSDEETRKHLATVIQQEVRQEWSWEAKGEELERLYEKTISTN